MHTVQCSGHQKGFKARLSHEGMRGMATEAGKHERPPSLAQRRVGQRLKGWRERARKTQEDAAAALLVHHTKIYRIESGRTLPNRVISGSCPGSTEYPTARPKSLFI